MSLLIKTKDYGKKHPKLIPLARVEGGSEDKKVIYLDENGEGKTTEIKLTSGKLIVLPRLDKIEKLYVSGVSGSGKSTYISNWLKEYLKKTHKQEPVYVFSSVSYDKILDDKFPDNIERIDCDESLISEPIDPEDLTDCVVLMDDTDSILNKKVNKTIVDLRDNILERGRHTNTRMLCTSHILSNYKATRKLLNEATTVVVFPKSGQSFLIRTFLEKYCGMDKIQIKKFMGLKSRYVSITRQYCPYVMYSSGVYLLNTD